MRNFYLKKKLKFFIMSEFIPIIEMGKDKNNIEFIIEEKEEVVEPTLTEFEKVSKSQADIYYKFRYTFMEEDNDLFTQQAIARSIIRELKRYMVRGYYTAGIEHFSSGMVDAKPHLHIHFVSRDKKDTIRKHLHYNQDEKYGEKAFDGKRGRYALCQEVIVHEERFWRYPLKQQKNDTKRFCNAAGFTKDAVISMIDKAYDHWVTASEIENAKKEKKEVADLLSERLFQYLDTHVTQRCDRNLKIAIQRFYIVEEQRPFNKTTAYGYLLNYKIIRGLMTHDELEKTW